jgi:hypothetical protein
MLKQCMQHMRSAITFTPLPCLQAECTTPLCIELRLYPPATAACAPAALQGLLDAELLFRTALPQS